MSQKCSVAQLPLQQAVIMTIIGQWYREGEWQDVQLSISKAEDLIALSMWAPHNMTAL